MDLGWLGPDAGKDLREVAGYLNYSSGAADPRFLGSLNRLFGTVLPREFPDPLPEGIGRPIPPWRALDVVLGQGLQQLKETAAPFRQVEQAEAVLRIVFDDFLPAYRRHHRDLLFHQTDESLFQPLFIGRAFEAVLSEGGPWQETERIVDGAMKRLNDYLGHRPVPVLRTAQKIEPYAHERVRPIPLYIAGAGVTTGRYQDLIEKTLELLRSTDPELLRQAWFDPEVLGELSLDPRALDFDHPVNRRPNHHFGGWDPHQIDNQGRYRRFVLQQVTLDALWQRVENRGDIPYEEMLFEAAAVLAGTMLMGSGMSGSGPDTHDSSVTIAKLLPVIAGYRDAFYERLLKRLRGPQVERLRKEAQALRQPFGGARQHLNQMLARRRAEQLQHVHLARLLAKMGYTEAAMRQAHAVPVASARMRCQIDCRMTTAHLAIDRGRLDEAALLLPEIEDLLRRAIECGAMVDPWNILGFGGQYSLFPAIENSTYDHRVDELIDLMDGIFNLYARLEKEAAAAGQTELQQRLSSQMEARARWWDQFATIEVGGVEGFSGQEMWQSAGQVAEALAAWHRAGTAAGDVGFWRQHVERFSSPRGFALLAESLLDLGDLVAAMGLLTYWLSRAEEIPLAENSHSFHVLATRWMDQLWSPGQAPRSSASSAASTTPADSASAASAGAEPPRANDPADRWLLTRKFLDYLEANADEYWQVPELDLMRQAAIDEADEDGEEEDDDEEESEEDDRGGLFSAAYEDVTYRDTTDDGFEGEILESGQPITDFELAAEAERIGERLAFLGTLARVWKRAAEAAAAGENGDSPHLPRPTYGRCPPEGGFAQMGTVPIFPLRREVLSGWLRRAGENRRQLLKLLAGVHRYRIPEPRSDHDALVEYAQRQGVKEMLLERVIAACVETADAARRLAGALDVGQTRELEAWEMPAERVLQSALRGDVAAVRRAWPHLLALLRRQPLLYIPVSRGGNPHRVVASRGLQRTLARLLAAAPRLGLLTETYKLIVAIQQMEQGHPVGPGALTEFDRLFAIGCQGIIRSIVVSSEGWGRKPSGKRPRGRRSERELIECLDEAVEPLLTRWLGHSRNIRLSVLETVQDDDRWDHLQQFIQRYGHDLFTQRFMNYGNLRAILHEGVDRFLEMLQAQASEDEPLRLLDELGGPLSRKSAAGLLELILEAIVENYSEYIDYNSTTTQSDRGEMLYTLLDFLRVETSYDRMAWNLRPVVLVHEVLVHCGRKEAAGQWRRTVQQRTRSMANEHLKRFEQLVKRYGMRLPSVAQRLDERFVRPLDIDRLRALVRPAVEELRAGLMPVAFTFLEEEIAQLTEEPGGVGFEVPGWLESLEEEVSRLDNRVPDEEEELADADPAMPQVRLSRTEIERQIEEWDK
jgi:hypothetical protein